MAKKQTKHLLLIDGMAIIFRGYFALFDRPRLTSDGLNASALHVFVNTVHGLLERFDPSHVVMCFDSKPPTFRHKLFEDYKSNRGEMPADLSEALPYIFKLCKAMNIHQLRKSGWEADDIIATVVKRAEQANWQCHIYSPDKDLAQVVSAQTTLYRPGKKGSLDVFDQAAVCEKWGLQTPRQLIDVQALMGDSVDCIPGVPGIGEKTAIRLIQTYGDLENCIRHVDELKGRQRENLDTYQDAARLSYELARMRQDCSVAYSLADFKRAEYNERALLKLFQRLEFVQLAKRFFKADIRT